MKRLIYAYLLFFLVACSNNKVPLNDEAFENVPELFDEKEEAFAYQTILEQKLQDYFDLLVLKDNFPEFREGVSSQLQKVANDSILIQRNLGKVSIENLEQVGSLVVISDAEKRMTLSFDMMTNETVKRDTITAIIKTDVMYIDSMETVATKILFVRNND